MGDDRSEAGSQQPVPGEVRLVTRTPIAMPLSAAGGQDSLGEMLEERPWLVAACVVLIAGAYLLLRSRRARG